MLTVINRDYFFMNKDELSKANLDELVLNSFLLEPYGRNTAAAIAIAALQVADGVGRDACLLVLPADHLVQKQSAFVDAVAGAQTLARKGFLVTFGVVPDSPETGFGYIEGGPDLAPGKVVQRFVEKPAAQTTQEYLAAGNYYWNSGMFCFTAGTMLDQLAEHAPDVFQSAQTCWNSMSSSVRPSDGILENLGVLDLVMIEVQSGEYLGEDDIVLRIQDVYGRC